MRINHCNLIIKKKPGKGNGAEERKHRKLKEKDALQMHEEEVTKVKIVPKFFCYTWDTLK